ncbi:DUF2141 domain-containing protein [Polaribacter sargassicola]|uniref:DUF2141 domain-containing protein n=1 Tax=Polaribacter sargassicola TaxID=2836891 RepID=UPI001F187E3C|nr:DUF2141 domain-containing protein [Polaribacter sp. DS7-9]MCG1036681.1 DUF2141 domain-containing protein [Polaribacter sp. DS7-9]
MKFLLAVIMGAMLFITNNVTAQKKTITATVVNAVSDEGKVGFALYDKANFRIIPLQASASKIKEGKSVVTFKNVEVGEYAIICYHDKNNNEKMDFNSYGMPMEDYGASNNVMNFGPPNYEDAKFTVSDKDVSLIIKF